MIDLFGNDTPYPVDKRRRLNPALRNDDGSWKINPMVLKFGEAEGKKCKHCKHMVIKQYGNRYFKCRLRGNVGACSPASDHRWNWPACSKFEEQDD